MRIYDPKKILVPVDFSEFSAGVVRAALEIGRKWGAELLVLHVAQESDHVPPIPVASYREINSKLAATLPSRSQLVESAQLQLEDRLREILQPLAPGPEVRTAVVWGDPLRQIVRTAEEGDYDLIIMATHGRGGLSRFLLGSVTEHVIRRAPCPVLAIRAKVAEAQQMLAAAGQAAG